MERSRGQGRREGAPRGGPGRLRRLLRALPRWLAPLVGLASLLGVAQSGTSDGSAAPAPPPLERSELDRSHEAARRLTPDQFSAFVDEGEAPLRLRALVLRAGMPEPPGLSSARAARRRTARGDAQAWVLARLKAGDEELARELERILTDPTAPDLLWAAAADVAGRALESSLAEAIGTGLAPERSERVRAAARRALHTLFLRWFADAEELAAARAEAGFECGTYFRDRLVELDALARQQAIRLIELEPAGGANGRSARALLGHSDPALRAAAARVLGLAIASGTVDTSETIAALSTHLEVEVDAAVWYATLRALLEPLASAPIDSPELVGLRALLDRAAERPDLRSSVAWALTRMPWDTKSRDTDSSVLAGIERMSLLFEECALHSAVRDEDELLTVLGALESLLQTASSAGIDLHEGPQRVRELLLSLAADPEASSDLRAGAAASLSLVAQADDVSVLASVLDTEGLSTSLAYTLLGALGRLAEQARPGTPEGAAVLDALVGHTRDADVDLRSRALSLLLEPRLEPLAHLTRPEIWIEALEAEDQPALRTSLLRLLARHGQARNLDALLASPAFERSVAGADRQLAELTAVLRAWTAGDPGLVQRAARGLAASGRPAALQSALLLCAGVAREGAETLPRQAHCEIVRWAFALRVEKDLLRDMACPEGRMLARVLDLHLPACRGEDAAGLEREEAVLTALLQRVDPGLAAGARVAALFERALARAEESGDARARLALYLDRARWSAANGERVAALSDYRRAFGFEDALALGVDGWTPRDLRQAEDLTRTAAPRAPELAPDPDLALEGALYLERLVGSAAWRNEPADLRLLDLEAWAARALESHDVIRIAAVRQALAGPARDGLEAYAQELEALEQQLALR